MKNDIGNILWHLLNLGMLKYVFMCLGDIQA